MSESAIKVDHVTKVYKLYNKPKDRLKESLGLTKKKLSRDHYALRDISFDVKKGETVGIIGTNGSGKSTILKIITGVLNPTSGNVQVDGRISALLETALDCREQKVHSYGTRLRPLTTLDLTFLSGKMLRASSSNDIAGIFGQSSRPLPTLRTVMGRF